MNRQRHHNRWWDFVRYNLSFFCSRSARLPNGHIPEAPHTVPSNAFGICVAASGDPSVDTYILDHLKRLGIKNVRIDISTRDNAHTKRLLDHLLTAHYKVLLHPVQPVDEARKMDDHAALEAWKQFIEDLLDAYGEVLDIVEIGSTCNRRRWSGYTPARFLAAWSIAHKSITDRSITIAGPNVSDFEPLYNVGYLGIMSAFDSRPDIHTNNLFVERVTEPERFDHRILGRWLGRYLKFNLIKKARLFQKIGQRYGVMATMSPHVAWSLRRINRVLINAEEKQADYLARYLCLIAASGALTRCYWGPMIGQREGLIDDGSTEYPDHQHVTYYGMTRGKLSDYRLRPAFAAYKTAVSFLAGSQYKGPLATAAGLEIHAFQTETHTFHVAWTMNGKVADMSRCYAAYDLQASTICARDGNHLKKQPLTITETPIYLSWIDGREPDLLPEAHIEAQLCVFNTPDTDLALVHTRDWTGAVICGDASDVAEAFLPGKLETCREKKVLRNRRNVVWSMPHPGHKACHIIVKRQQVRKWYRRLLQRWRISRARRSWNGAHELCRRGIATGTPVAFFESRENPSLDDSYFVYERFEATDSVRQAFTAFSEGTQEYLDHSRDAYFKALAAFIRNMHNRGVYFRDLSAGNVLCNKGKNDQLEFSLIDTGRARFSEHALSMGLRCADLKRIAHPLTWSCRHAFLEAYMSGLNKPVTARMRLPLHLYDLKHWIKKNVAPLRRLGRVKR